MGEAQGEESWSGASCVKTSILRNIHQGGSVGGRPLLWQKPLQGHQEGKEDKVELVQKNKRWKPSEPKGGNKAQLLFILFNKVGRTDKGTELSPESLNPQLSPHSRTRLS